MESRKIVKRWTREKAESNEWKLEGTDEVAM
jgi:hypothetical protein